MRALVLAFLLLASCGNPVCAPQNHVSGGVRMVAGGGCGCADGYIVNENSFEVGVRKVWQFRGETTMEFRILKPGERWEFEGGGSHQIGYHIFNKEVEIGWLERIPAE